MLVAERAGELGRLAPPGGVERRVRLALQPAARARRLDGRVQYAAKLDSLKVYVLELSTA